MGLVAFAILFAGVLDDYVVAARAAVTLTFVLPVMVPADAAEIPTRLAGWGLAGALCIPAALLLWPARPRSVLRREVAQVAQSLAESGGGDVPRRSPRCRHRRAEHAHGDGHRAQSLRLDDTTPKWDHRSDRRARSPDR